MTLQQVLEMGQHNGHLVKTIFWSRPLQQRLFLYVKEIIKYNAIKCLKYIQTFNLIPFIFFVYQNIGHYYSQQSQIQ